MLHLLNGTLIRFEGVHGEQAIEEPCEPQLWRQFADRREALLLDIADTDDILADQVLSGRQPDGETLWAALRQATLSGKLYPCFGGSALHNLGVQPVIDGVIKLLPCPLDRPPATAFLANGDQQRIEMTDKGPLTALAFKVQMWEGRRHVFARLYRGTLKPGDRVSFQQPDGRTLTENVARIFDVDAAKKTRIDQAHAGEIVLLAGLRHAATGDTLCDPQQLVSLERIETRKPVLSRSIEPASSDQEDKFLEVMEKLQEEDPTLKFSEDPDTGQRLLSGMGELHLQIVVERLEREFNLPVKTGKPAVALRETVTSMGLGDHLFQPPLEPTGRGEPLRVRVVARVTPAERGTGVHTTISPKILPENTHFTVVQQQALERGVRFALGGGPIEGAPLEDVDIQIAEVEFFGSSIPPIEILEAAVSRAVGMALAAGAPVLLQPIMVAEIVVPEQNLGTVLGDLQARHAVIRDTRNDVGMTAISCEMALAQLLGYTTVLRSMTQGRGQFSTEFDRFDHL